MCPGSVQKVVVLSILVFTSVSKELLLAKASQRCKHPLNRNGNSVIVRGNQPTDGQPTKHGEVWNHHLHDCLLHRIFRRRSKKTSKLRATGLCARNSPVTGEFPTQRVSNAEDVSIWWRHHVFCLPLWWSYFSWYSSISEIDITLSLLLKPVCFSATSEKINTKYHNKLFIITEAQWNISLTGICLIQQDCQPYRT